MFVDSCQTLMGATRSFCEIWNHPWLTLLFNAVLGVLFAGLAAFDDYYDSLFQEKEK